MGRLDSRDYRFLAICLAVLIGGAFVIRAGFTRAFPEASIDFKVTKSEAVAKARADLGGLGFDLGEFRALAVFDHDDDTKVYLERTLGLRKANEAFATTIPIWRWEIRFVKELSKLEYRAHVAPDGTLLAYRRLLPEKTPAADPGEAEARRLAEAALVSHRRLSPDDVTFVDLAEERRESRVDRTYAWRSNRVRVGEGTLKYLVEVQGDRVSRSTMLFEVPDAFRRDYQALRAQNDTASAVASLGLFLTAIAILVVFAERIRRRDVKWRLALGFGLVALVLQLGASLNELPLNLYGYDSTDTWTVFVTKTVLGSFGGAVSLGLAVAVLLAAGEPLFRERYPKLPALSRLVSLKALGTRSVFRGLVLGYAMTAAFVAYQVTFYVVAERLGAWAPMEVPYSNLLGTTFPWLGVLLMGFMPATTEEFSSRLFSIPFLERFVPRWAAVVIPAFIWGFAHSAYPNQPFFIRGLEVGLAGVAVGLVMLRYGMLPLLVWHFTVDAVYTALLLVRSSSTYFVVSGLLASLSLLLPLLIAIVLYVRNRGFLPEDDLSNASVGTAPDVERPSSRRFELVFSPDRPARRSLVAALFALALVAAVVALRAPRPPELDLKVDRTNALALASELVTRMGDLPDGYVKVPELVSTLPRISPEEGSSPIPYGWSSSLEEWIVSRGGLPLLSRWATRILPGVVWEVRFLRPEDHHGWRVVVDARTGAIVGYRRTLPREEKGAFLDSAAARQVADGILKEQGIDPSSLTLVSATAETQTGRRDHRFVFDTADAEGEARRRIVLELLGDRPSLLATGVKLPEDFLRARQKTTTAGYVGIGLFVIGLGSFVGITLLALGRVLLRGHVPWRLAIPAALLLTLPTLLRQLVSLPQVFRAYPDPALVPLALFSITSFIGLVVGLVLNFGGALVALGLVLAMRGDALAAFRTAVGRRAAVGRGLIAAGVLLGVRLLAGSFDFTFPLEVGIGGFPLPAGVETFLPAAEAIESGVRLMLILGAAAALGSLLLSTLLVSTSSRVVVAVLFALGTVPTDARTVPQLLIPTLQGLLMPAAILAVLAVVLRSEPRAYLIAALLFACVGGAAPLLQSSVLSWQLNGAALIALPLALCAYWGLTGAREGPAGT